MMSVLHKTVYLNAKHFALERIFAMKQSPPPPVDLPCTCRVCGGALEAKQQLTGIPEKPAYWIVTCWNRACGLYSVTRSASLYPTFDLTPYLEKVETL